MNLLAAVLFAAALALHSSTNSHVRIRSRSCDVDRKAGVVMLDGDVSLEHSDGYRMRADVAYLFMTASNELSRVVASGNVSISDATREATCPMAVYRRRRREVEMFGDGSGTFARLAERGPDGKQLEGKRIRFWLDSEQAEVEEPRITIGSAGGKGGLP